MWVVVERGSEEGDGRGDREDRGEILRRKNEAQSSTKVLPIHFPPHRRLGLHPLPYRILLRLNR